MAALPNNAPSSKVAIGAVVGALCLAAISLINGLDLGFQIGAETGIAITAALTSLAAYLKPETRSTV